MSDREIEKLIASGAAHTRAARSSYRRGRSVDARRYLARAAVVLEVVRSAALCQAVNLMANPAPQKAAPPAAAPSVLVPRDVGVLAA